MKYRSQHGFTMIEVLVAILIIVFGILGAAALDTTAKSGTFDAGQRTLATALASDILERMNANTDGVDNGDYDGSYGDGSLSESSCVGTGVSCDSAALAEADLYEWEQQLIGAGAVSDDQNVGGLVNVTGCIENDNGRVTVVIVWRGKTALSDPSTSAEDFVKDCGLTGEFRRQVVVESFIDI